MPSSVATFAQLASEAFNERDGFEASQTIHSSGLRIEAHVRRLGPRSIHVEYRSYQSPWLQLQESLTGLVEFVADELCSMTLDCDGHHTWIMDRSSSTAWRKKGCQLYEAIPGLSMVGELSFLERLSQDFLLRDEGEHTVADRCVRRMGLKPKVSYRSALLSTVTFPIRKATVDFDSQTYFPLQITFFPSEESPAASILGPQASIHISYNDVRILKEESSPAAFTVPEDFRQFDESTVVSSDIDQQLPFSVNQAILGQHGFDAESARAVMNRDSQSDRAYVTLQYASPAQPTMNEATPDERPISPMLTLTVGNYVSRNMARRRKTISEDGQLASDPSLPLKLLDRKPIWESQFQGIDTRHAPVEAFFEKDGVYWYASATGIALDSLESLALDLLHDAPASATDEDED